MTANSRSGSHETFEGRLPDWDLVREPAPLRAGDHLIFPDFAIYHRRDPTRRALLEIVGFWTPRYLEAELQRLRAAGAPNLIRGEVLQ